MNEQPLAEQLRPKNLKEFVGQKHILQKNKILHDIVKQKHLVSLVLWGPPGSGKTTLARIIANESGAQFIELSATSSGKADVMKVIDRASANKRLGQETILFIDEIHRFNKAQQDAFLPHVEDGTITLIGATTENPSFEVVRPLLSRTKVIVLQPLLKTDIKKIIKNAASKLSIKERITNEAIDTLAEISGGDARIALNNLQLASQLAKGTIDKEVVIMAAAQKVPNYDKKGEGHYNVASAFIKSMRGGDVSASLYYLARMIRAGEDPKFIARRMVIFASEDIGIEASAALNIAVSTFSAVQQIGMPECQYNLFHCAFVLTKCKKSRVVADVMQEALRAAERHPDLPVPLHVRNAPTKLMKDLGYSKGYKWQAGYKDARGFLPEELKDFTLEK